MPAISTELPRTSTVAEPERAWDWRDAGATARSPREESRGDRAGVILTPDQRVRVFISSTLAEMAEERAAARRAIERLHLVPVWYESGARPHPPRSMYRAYLEQSQVFVGIYWQRYGWVAPGMDISGLEDEYRLAAGKPMLLYLKRPAPDTEPRMKEFLDSIREAGTVSYRTFATPRELERLLAEDLAVLLSESFNGAAASAGARDASPGGAADAGLPTGTVTFLFTDIEGSTRRWETDPGAMARALALHNETLRAAFGHHGGVVYSTMGDGMVVAFPSAVGAAAAALEAQRALLAAPWPAETGVLKVRMGLHTDEAVLRDGQYVNTPLNRCARLMAAAHGGQIVMSDATEALVRSGLPGGATLIDLGEHRLRDLAGRMRIFQIAHPELPRTFPALRTLEAFAGNLPMPASSFIGRARELEQTSAALGQARVVTLTGAGGVGKTRLALQVARQVLPRFADGAWVAELAAVRDAVGVDDAVAAVFSVTARAGQSTCGAVVEFLHTKELLLILDNCEHLLAGAAALARALQRSCPGLVILATSREGLGIDGEQLVPVPPLKLTGADDDSLETIRQAEAVRLFTDRAAAVKPGFTVTEENAGAVAAVVRRLDGIALAIELAAARVPAMTPAELARRLDRSFAVLAGGRRGAVDRHQTLRAAIDWSFQLLTEPEQALLGRLAVFADGCTLQGAEAVCGGDGIDPGTVFELLASLVARSLVVADEYGPGTRYRLLETIRQYGQERLDQGGQTERWRARHADYYASLLRQVRQHARPDEGFWAARLSAEQDNLFAAWSWATGTGNLDTAFSILAGFAPSEIWNTYPLLLPGGEALQLPGAAEHTGYPLALAVSAVFASIRADVTGAEELCRRAADANARRDTPDWRVQEVICAARQNIANTRGAFADAARLAEQAAELAQAGGDLADASVELTIAVADHVLVDDPSKAVPLAREALALARQAGAPALIATGLLAVGVAVAVTDAAQARACLRESRELSTALGYHSAIDLIWATAIASLTHDRTGTLDLGRDAIRGLQRRGDRLRMAVVLHMIADALAVTHPAPAAIIHGAAEAHVVALPNPAGPLTLQVPALDEQCARELRTRGADMDWDQAVAYALAQAAQVRSGPEPETQP